MHSSQVSSALLFLGSTGAYQHGQAGIYKHRGSTEPLLVLSSLQPWPNCPSTQDLAWKEPRVGCRPVCSYSLETLWPGTFGGAH